MVPRGRVQHTCYIEYSISCFPPVHFPPTVALTRVPGCATAGHCDGTPNIGLYYLRNVVTRVVRGSQRTSAFGCLYSARRGYRSQMSLIVVFNMHRGGVATHSQCAGWNLPARASYGMGEGSTYRGGRRKIVSRMRQAESVCLSFGPEVQEQAARAWRYCTHPTQRAPAHHFSRW